MNTTTIRRMAAGALVLSLALTACGSDGGDEAAGATTAAAPKTACDAAIEVSNLFNQGPDDPAAIKGFAADTMVPAAKKLAAALPSDLADAGRAIQQAYEDVAAKGDPSVFEAKAYADATAATGKMVHERCGLKDVDVVAKDYVFTNLPAKLPAGRTSVSLQNEGTEMHEIVLFKKAAGETRKWDELSQLPQEEQGKAVTFSGVAFGAAGSTAYTTVELEPGTYIAVCTMPMGGHDGGEPHFMKGMVQEITVS